MTRFGVSTVQPGEDATALPDQVDHADVTRIVVTRSDGTLVGLFFAADVTPASVTEAVVCKELTACVAMDSGQRRELIGGSARTGRFSPRRCCAARDVDRASHAPGARPTAAGSAGVAAVAG